MQIDLFVVVNILELVPSDLVPVDDLRSLFFRSYSSFSVHIMFIFSELLDWLDLLHFFGSYQLCLLMAVFLLLELVAKILPHFGV